MNPEATLTLDEAGFDSPTSNAVKSASLSAVPSDSLQQAPAPTRENNARGAAPDQELIGRAAAGSAAVAAVAKAASPSRNALKVRRLIQTVSYAKTCCLLLTSA